jgi:lipoyl(octanoyl) transferase
MSKKSNNNIEWLISKEPVYFEEALKFMENRVEKIIKGEANSLIWLLEHHQVYTAGISAKDEDLLHKTAIPVFKTNRGGKYTYHGPGMKIIYVMLDLKNFFAPLQPDIAKFVEFLENWIISVLEEMGIKGEIRKGRVGIWVDTKDGEKKIGAIGIKVKKWVTYHGIAVNISPNLKAFENIVPCGIKEFGVTSLKDLNVKINENFDQLLKRKFLEN